MKRPFIIAFGVLVLHLAALWLLQTGLTRRAVERVVHAEILTVAEVSPLPTAKPRPATKRKSARHPEAALPVTVQTAAPQQLTSTAPTPSDKIASGIATTMPLATVAVPGPATPSRLELPDSDADYLQNPKPHYPALSKRLGEQGNVMVRVLIGVNGSAQKAEIKQSSGFDRLDQSALDTVRRWRYVPGTRAGVPEAMWFNVPIRFILE